MTGWIGIGIMIAEIATAGDRLDCGGQFGVDRKKGML